MAKAKSLKSAPPWHVQTCQALRNILNGETPGNLPPLDLSEGSDFQRLVWKAMLAIKSGEVRTYGRIAADIGHPKACRAVGVACGANPIPVLVPCHRVVAANGGLGGFSGPPEWKQRLLVIEKALASALL